MLKADRSNLMPTHQQVIRSNFLFQKHKRVTRANLLFHTLGGDHLLILYIQIGLLKEMKLVIKSVQKVHSLPVSISRQWSHVLDLVLS